MTLQVNLMKKKFRCTIAQQYGEWLQTEQAELYVSLFSEIRR